MPASKALMYYLGELDQPVVTEYQLAVFLFKAYHDKNFKEIPINSRVSQLSKNIFNNKLKRFCETGVLTPHPSFPGNRVFSIMGKKGVESGDIACAVNPFVYMSHLSAMAYHGFTDRIPTTLFISGPNAQNWSKFSCLKMEKDLGELLEDYLQAGLPKLRRISMQKIGKMPVNHYSSSHLGAYKNVKDRPLRVSSVGRTFLDMVREPSLCGGMKHCIDIYKQYGRQYKTLIIDELNRHAKQIEKSRVGYLLENICGVTDDNLDEWSRHVQRGGSRKLDPTNEYESGFSARWCISLNVPEMELIDAVM